MKSLLEELEWQLKNLEKGGFEHRPVKDYEREVEQAEEYLKRAKGDLEKARYREDRQKKELTHAIKLLKDNPPK